MPGRADRARDIEGRRRLATCQRYGIEGRARRLAERDDRAVVNRERERSVPVSLAEVPRPALRVTLEAQRQRSVDDARLDERQEAVGEDRAHRAIVVGPPPESRGRTVTMPVAAEAIELDAAGQRGPGIEEEIRAVIV